MTIGTWEIGYHAPITEQYYWSLPLRDFYISNWNMTPVSGIKSAEPGVNLTEWVDYDEFFTANPNITRVFIEPRTEHQNPDTTWLHNFEHPEDCVYVFGSAHYNPTLRHCREGDIVVSIKTNDDKGVLWADQALCIVLYDRMVKSWQLQ
jgi:hypothetical protein